MELHRPLATIAPTLDADVLAVLVRGDRAFTGREVARLVPERSQRGIHNALARLVAQGVVTREHAGPAHQYRLNREHLCAPHIEAIVRIRTEFDRRVAELVDGWELPAELVALFGSAARGEMHADSHLDVLVIGPTDDPTGRWDAQTEQLARRIQSWTGNDCRVLEMGPREVRARITTDPLLATIKREGQVIYGSRTALTRLGAHRPAE